MGGGRCCFAPLFLLKVMIIKRSCSPRTQGMKCARIQEAQLTLLASPYTNNKEGQLPVYRASMLNTAYDQMSRVIFHLSFSSDVLQGRVSRWIKAESHLKVYACDRGQHGKILDGLGEGGGHTQTQASIHNVHLVAGCIISTYSSTTVYQRLNP
jgi:hypothetical protein